jgi:sirohydrochlorin ferrochelatase
LAGIHVSEDIPHEVAIAQSKLQNRIPLRILPHLGTHLQIPDLLVQQFEKYTDQHSPEKQARILVSHGSRRTEANQVVENLAKSSQAIAAYWGIEPKIETQIEHLIAQGIDRINVLPYFLTEGGITEAIANKLKPYSDRAQIRQLPVPLSNEQLVNLALSMI